MNVPDCMEETWQSNDLLRRSKRNRREQDPPAVQGYEPVSRFRQRLPWRTDHFSDRLKPAAYLEVRDYLRFGNLPPMAGLYPPCQVQFLQQEFGATLAPGDIDGILLSHGHIDHFGFLPLVDVNVPLYMSAETLEVLRFFDETGQFDLRMDQRHVTVFEHDKVMRIGNCEVLPVRSDHDILGILGFIVRCNGTSITYTGDSVFTESIRSVFAPSSI